MNYQERWRAQVAHRDVAQRLSWATAPEKRKALDPAYGTPAAGDGDARTLDAVYHFSGVADVAAAEALVLEPPAAGVTLESLHVYDDDKRPCIEWNDEVRQDYSYTSKNELASVTTTHASAPADGKTLSFTYYQTGQRETMQRPGESEPVRYHYDAMNRLSVLDDPVNGERFDFEYDAYGRRSKLSFPNGLATYYEYTAAGAQESILTVDAAGVPLQSWVYAYDSAGNPISKTDIDGKVERYGYDSRARLVRTDYPAGTSIGAGGLELPHARFDAYRYDPVGNRLESWREHGTIDGQVLHVSSVHDAANRLLSETSDASDDDSAEWSSAHEWMAQGAMLTRTVTPATGAPEVTSFTYDPADRLLGYTVDLDSHSASYDSRGRRVSVTQSPFGEASTSRRVIFDGLQEVVEFDGASGTAGEPPTRTQTTTRRLDEVIGSSLPPGPGETERPWRTHHGDLIQSGTLTADRDGGAESRGRYRAYGETLEPGDASWGFAGRPHEIGGLVPLRARAYAPGLGAFVSADALDGYAGAPQTQADYAYGGNSPQANADPTGAIQEGIGLLYVGIGLSIWGQLASYWGAMTVYRPESGHGPENWRWWASAYFGLMETWTFGWLGFFYLSLGATLIRKGLKGAGLADGIKPSTAAARNFGGVSLIAGCTAFLMSGTAGIAGNASVPIAELQNEIAWRVGATAVTCALSVAFGMKTLGSIDGI